MRLILLLTGLLAMPVMAQNSMQAKVYEALQQDIRNEDEIARDGNRQPAEVLDFFGLREDMRVIELIPAGGWYTKILSHVLREEGKLYVTYPAHSFYSEMFAPLRVLPELAAVEVLDWGSQPPGDDPFFGPGSWQPDEPVDMVLTFRNYHNFDEEDRMAINRAAYEALAPGGVYGIVDHTRRHMEPDYPENWRRVDPVQVIREVQASGFVFEDYSDLLWRPTDALLFEVGSDAVVESDRFTLRFRKP